MKKRNIVMSALASLALVLSVAIVSCEKEESPAGKGSMYYDAASKASFNLDDQAQLNQLAKILSKEVTEITIVKDAAVLNLTDSKGNFKAISVRYKVGEYITTLTVPIDITAPENAGI